MLKALKVDLKKWNDEVFGVVGKKKELLEGIREWDCIEEGRGLVKERMRNIDMIKELEKTLLFEEINWRQKGTIIQNFSRGWPIRIVDTITWNL